MPPCGGEQLIREKLDASIKARSCSTNTLPRSLNDLQVMVSSYAIHLTLYDQDKGSSNASTSSLALYPALREAITARRQRDHAFIPDDIWRPLPHHSHPSANAFHQRTFAQYTLPVDYRLPAEQTLDPRFGPISIDWADYAAQEERVTIADMSTYANVAGQSSSSVPIEAPVQPQSLAGLSSAPVGRFVRQVDYKPEDRDAGAKNAWRGGSSDRTFLTGSAEVAYGVVHLFRDREEAMRSAADEQISSSVNKASSSANTLSVPDQALESRDDSGTVLAVLAVPSRMAAAEFLSFVEPALDAISHLRMIREARPNQGMILIKFRDAFDAAEFQKMFDGQPFNAMDADEVCQVVYVTSVTISSTSQLPYTYPLLANSDPWPILSTSNNSPLTRPRSHSSSTAGVGEGSVANDSTADRLAASLIHELPTCPVCLERMDANISGLMTVTCQHTFHCSCLSKWADGRCPVCRYSSTRQRAIAGSSSDLDGPGDAVCTVCQTTTDLWVCLICASVGCGRYKAGHAHRHYEETKHLYSLELETQRVWDYAGDGYVHRLIQNKTDGKLVELPSANAASESEPSGKSSAWMHGGGRDDAAAQGEKIEAIGLEYSYLLTSQLESQRTYYEDKLRKAQQGLDSNSSSTAGASSSVASGSSSSGPSDAMDAQLQRFQHMMDAKMAAAEERTNELRERIDSERAALTRKLDKAVSLARTLDKELQAERAVSRGLMENMDKLRENDAKMREELAESKEQVRDLMVFLSARDKIGEGEEMAGGDVSVGTTAESTGGGKGKKKKGKK